jgi:peptidoglycan/xylan/chitin deacetylase (PgdA/CDA1 family)
MSKKSLIFIFLPVFIFVLGAVALLLFKEKTPHEMRVLSNPSLLKKTDFAKRSPKAWGMDLPGVITRIKSDKKVIALTFDACGGESGTGYDSKLIKYLRREKIPATLFVSGSWIDAHRDVLRNLAADPLFEIENHGLRHRPLSVSGRSAYGIKGTRNIEEVFEEIEGNALKIEKATGWRPRFFRSGTAHYDDVGLEILASLGYKAVGFSVNGDGGATYTREKIKKTLAEIEPRSIVIMHFNHPEKDTAEGVMAAVPILKKKGFSFVRLNSCEVE